MKQVLLAFTIGFTLLAIASATSAQQPMVYTTTPLQTNGDRFFESTNMNWSLRGPNFFATFGGPNVGIPRFGGYNPNAGISSGWAFNSGRFSGTFGFNFSQGYERFSTTTAPSLMTTNGQTGQFFSGIRRPFVYSLVPVVSPGGAFFSAPSPAFHQEYRHSRTLAERVLRGEIILPDSRSAMIGTSTSGQHQSPNPGDIPGNNPSSDRANAAFAWFQDSHPSSPSLVDPKPSLVSPAEPIKGHVEKLLANHSDKSGTEQAIPAELSTDAETSSSDKIAEVYFQRGLEAVAKKEIESARFLFRLAARKASSELGTRIQQQLTELDGK